MPQSTAAEAAAFAAAAAATGGFNLDSLRALLSIPPESRRARDVLLIARQMSALACFQGMQAETLIIAAATAHRNVLTPNGYYRF